MEPPKEKKYECTSCIDPMLLDLSSLVGREISIFSEQFPGQKLSSRVIMVNESKISLDRGSNAGKIDDLVNNQKVIMQFAYKGEQVSVNATLKRTPSGQCNLLLGDKIVPLTRRKFRRYPINHPSKLAIFSQSIANAKLLSKLQWRESTTINISSGGALIEIPSVLLENTFSLINIPFQEMNLPKLIIARVRHCYQSDKGHFRVGMEFVVKEEKENLFDKVTLKCLPNSILEYSIDIRSKVDEKLKAWMHENE